MQKKSMILEWRRVKKSELIVCNCENEFHRICPACHQISDMFRTCSGHLSMGSDEFCVRNRSCCNTLECIKSFYSNFVESCERLD